MLLLAVLAALAFGAWRAASDGRFRRSAAAPAPTVATSAATTSATTSAPTSGTPGPETAAPSLLSGTPYAEQLGERATLLQFSSAFCAPCRVTRRTLEEVSALVEGVAHVEVDAESQLELVRRLQVTRTPTTLVLDAHGREVTRAAGAPTKQQVLGALALVEAG